MKVEQETVNIEYKDLPLIIRMESFKKEAEEVIDFLVGKHDLSFYLVKPTIEEIYRKTIGLSQKEYEITSQSIQEKEVINNAENKE